MVNPAYSPQEALDELLAQIERRYKTKIALCFKCKQGACTKHEFHREWMEDLARARIGLVAESARAVAARPGGRDAN